MMAVFHLATESGGLTRRDRVPLVVISQELQVEMLSLQEQKTAPSKTFIFNESYVRVVSNVRKTSLFPDPKDEHEIRIPAVVGNTG
jgi:hypothetical protein